MRRFKNRMVKWPVFVTKTDNVLVEWLGFDMVFHSVAGTFNYDRFGAK
jgi:hypothetical protein